ncbi:MAG TPA: helix-turn-helix domain-containing protein [Candidatus Ruminococcus avistercoris]|nr:helix-turn-helix domain-containing protein [Candidatus Ruminococcus avistercoris]
MILADKITDLRKKNGWSQEELANQLGVSRQAVSKWESASSIPDLDKIVKMSIIFGVSTDYLLKDSLEERRDTEEILECNTAELGMDDEKGIRMISMETANVYLDLLRNISSRIALGVSLCILSPIMLIGLTGVSDKKEGMILSAEAAVGIGMTILLLMVAVAVAVFIIYGRKIEIYDFLEKEPIELAYGVKGLVEKEKLGYEAVHSRKLVLGIVLCILSAVPIMVLAVSDKNEMLTILGVNLCLILVSIGVYLLVSTGIVYGGFQKLLEEGDYTRSQKIENKRNDVIGKIYWCSATAIYLGWSFITMEWEKTWIVWPIAGVFYGAVVGISSVIRKH